MLLCYSLMASLLPCFLLVCYLSLAVRISAGIESNIMCLGKEREAFLLFRQVIIVDHCGLLKSWTNQEDNRDHCQWKGVHCSNRTGHNLRWLSNITLLRDINLSEIDLSKANYCMRILSNLPFLRVLHMDSCHLSPQIPGSLPYTDSSATLPILTLSSNFFHDASIFCST
ncbi:hypothetical protein Cgig2_005090 [Carnegiea gigantea]|uniref:Leucine-rich repeat-containing N-terminal plant-type domain-containing protein n=1 Tax=Carnegiea gigantea TaxID=171969 RepID=A0A9Q1L1F5_9CARY|nr:hypothetical protein Cgig2_005090 [Carnegiea gigantea]